MAVLYAYFDESGKFRDHEIISFCGFVDRAEAISQFGTEWRYWLRSRGLKCLHAKDALRLSSPLSKKFSRKNDCQDRVSALAPFVRLIKDHLELGVAVTVDVTAFKDSHQSVRGYFFYDPHYLAFVKAVYLILEHFKEDALSISLICDDDEEKAVECYRLLKKLKVNDERIRKRFVSICFCDDREYPPLQAADLFSSIMRQEGAKQFHDKPYPFGDLYSEFAAQDAKQKLNYLAGFWGKREFEQLEATLRKNKR